MKKFFLIPLLTLLCTVMAFATVHTAGTFAELQSALSAAANGDEIQLTDEITITGTGSTVTPNLSITKRTVTIDLNGHTLTDDAEHYISVGYNGDVTVQNGFIRVASMNSFTVATGGKLTFKNVKKVDGQDPDVGTLMYDDGIVVRKEPIHVLQADGTLILESDCDLNIVKKAVSGTLTNDGTGTIYLKPAARITDNSVKEYFVSLPTPKSLVPSSINASVYPNYVSYLDQDVKDRMFLTLTGNGNGTEIYKLKTTSDKGECKFVRGEKTYYFKDLPSAMKYSTDEYPYKLQGDTSLTVWTSAGYLDLNGKTLTLTQDDSPIVTVPRGQLTIMNSQSLAGGGIKITGEGTPGGYAFAITPSTKSAVNYSVLTIDAGVTINMPNWKGYFLTELYNDKGYGTVLNMNGTVNVPNGSGITLNGNTIAVDPNAPIFNIGGTINAKNMGIYAAGYGVWNISDGASITGGSSAIEMRAGNLTIDGGTFTANATEFENEANSNGSTTSGAAITVAQHTTKLPINVTINGGEFRAIYPIAQANPQKNEEAYVNNVNITVNGGKFWATNTANVAAYTQDNKLTLNGGYYNLAPHAFVAEGKIAKSNTDATTLAEGYLFEVAAFTPSNDVVVQNGQWQANTTWTDNTVPTEESNVTVVGDVTVENTDVAYAHNLTLNPDAKLTIKKDATLVLGNNAAVDPSANLVVEEGGQLLIAPTATPVQPVGSVTLVADGAGLKTGKTDHSIASNLYWQHFAIPTVGAPTSIALSYPNGTEITEAITYYNRWDIVNGWESIINTDLTEPFVGYNFSNIKPFGTNVNYTFTGQLVGNASSPLNFTRRGFNFFGNSYLAPINIQALQSSMYEQGLEFTVYVFTKQGNRQIYRAINEVTASIYGIDEIKPMQGFFMFAEKATEADFQYNSAVYSAFINKQNGGANNAPARRAASKYDAKAIIGIESAEGEYDEVVLVASNDFSDEYDLKADARKMENAGMNIYADGSFDNLAVMATNDLMGQTMSFKAGEAAQYTLTFSNVKGELALKDNVTNAVIAMNEGDTYTFAAQPNSVVEGRFEIVGRQEVPTAIENTEIKANVKGIYSITGMYLGENFDALPAGVYVVDGVKIVK